MVGKTLKQAILVLILALPFIASAAWGYEFLRELSEDHLTLSIPTILAIRDAQGIINQIQTIIISMVIAYYLNDIIDWAMSNR